MKVKGIILNKFNKALIIMIPVFIILIFTINLYSAAQFDNWGISKDTVLKKHLSPGEKTDEFTPIKNPNYENKIMNMVKLILKNVDADVDKKITIISTKTSPRKDFLVFNNKLFSVMEVYNSISKDELTTIVKKLSEQYGEPNYNPGSEMEIYFIASKNTKIIVHYYIKTKKCEIYYYDSQLYHKLSTNDY